MPKSDANSNHGRDLKQPDRTRRPEREQTVVTDQTAIDEGQSQLPAAMLGGDFSQRAFDHHAALLSDARLSQSMYAGQRSAIVMQLQRDYGNRYVRRLVKHISSKRTEAAQTKLTVGPAGDKHEQEADQVANQVVGMFNGGGSQTVERQEKGEQFPGKFGVEQRGELEKNQALQGKLESVQRDSLEGEESLQGEFATEVTPTQFQTTHAPDGNRTGLPDSLKAGLEGLSGLDLSGARVHDNSAKPAQLGALAYTQGQDIEVGPGQERHLPHEGWHVVQQMQGRVKPTTQATGGSINDDTGLEKEADVMGAKASQSVVHQPEGVAQKKSQEMTDSSLEPKQATQAQNNTPAVSEHAQIPVMQMKSALQGFNQVINSIGNEIKGNLGQILIDLSNLNKLDEDNAEQNICFASAWKGAAGDAFTSGDDRKMRENLIQSNFYGVGDALRNSRFEGDKTEFMDMENIEMDEGKQDIYTAFQNALFSRAERKDSNASTNGYLKYDKEKHGKKGSASEMPGTSAEAVQERAEGYLFVTKNRQEAVSYATQAQGGEREVLNIIADRTEVGLMKYDVDSGGYKTPEDLTGIVDDTMTDVALDNLNTWLPKNQPTKKEDADPILDEIL